MRFDRRKRLQLKEVLDMESEKRKEVGRGRKVSKNGKSGNWAQDIKTLTKRLV